MPSRFTQTSRPTCPPYFGGERDAHRSERGSFSTNEVGSLIKWVVVLVVFFFNTNTNKCLIAH